MSLSAKQIGYAQTVMQVGQSMGITPLGIQIAFATVFVETNWQNLANPADPESLNYPNDGLGYDGASDGLFQQTPPWWGSAQCRMDPGCAAQQFFTALQKHPYNSGQDTPGSYAQAVQQSAYPDRYDQRFPDAIALYNQLTQGNSVSDRPDFNEYPLWCDNNEDRGGTKIDLFLLHTEEGVMNADALAKWLQSTAGGSNPVSYHYTISTGYPNDDGVTVVDVVDTDLASWSVMASNDRSINLCFAGSYASWTRDDWLTKAGRAIDVAAYLCVQDCQKYGIPLNVIPPPYNSDPPGIADHRYCTEHLKDGNTHTDVGDGFPWDVFTAAVNKYGGVAPAPAPTPDPAPASEPTGDDATREVLEQLRGPWDANKGDFTGWAQCGQYPDGSNRSFVDGTQAKLDGLQTELNGLQTAVNNLTSMVAALMTQPPKTRFRWFHRREAR